MAERNLGVFEVDVVRAVMACDRDAYGLSITRAIEATAGRKVSIGSVYTTLDRLEEKGMLTSKWGEATAVRGGRRKRLYTVTAKGQMALQPKARSAPSAAEWRSGPKPQEA